MNRFSLSLLLLVSLLPQCQSQLRPPKVEILPSDTVGYSIVDAEANGIENRDHLAPVFDKLLKQRMQGGQKVTIVHIGDSHILGNFLTHEVRQRLQREFGDAGRGMIFPYKLANSNGPRDYLTESLGGWVGTNAQRIQAEETTHGLSGFMVETSNPKAELTFRLRDTATSETKLFTKVTVFQRKDARQFDLVVKDENSKQEAELLIEDEDTRCFYFDRPVGQVSICARKSTSQQKELRLDGICIENELAGVVYHSIGINGAEFNDFLRAKHFSEQLAELNPDLVIFSFGTNEAQGTPDPAYLRKQMDRLVNKVSENCPNAHFMFTTPADSYLRGKGNNPHMPVVSAIIKGYTREKGYALWDLFNLSGGENSAEAWKSRGLMSSDSVHYSKIGYAVQGKLLYQSIIKAYNRFVEGAP
jgi:lysophospholipase L1-like esterase